MKPRNEKPAWNGLRKFWVCRAGGQTAKAMSASARRQNVEAAAASLGIELLALQARVPDDLHAAFETLVRERVAMVLVFSDGMTLNERKRIALLAAAARLPTMFGLRQNVEDGGLMSYGTSILDAYRQSGIYVGKILKGAKPD